MVTPVPGSLPRVPIAILIVDDRQEQRIALRATLQELGEEIVEASSGVEALRQFLQRQVAVVLLDVNMPGMDGFETATLIRSRRSFHNTPILFLTADPNEAHAARGYALGAVDYILKPVDPQILKAKVSVFIELVRGREEASLHAQSLQTYTDQLQRLARAALEIHRTRSLEDVLQTMLDATMATVGAVQVAVDVDPSALGPIGKFHPAGGRRRSLHYPADTVLPELTSHALAMGTPAEPILLTRTELDAHPGWRAADPTSDAPPLQGWLAVPLFTRSGQLTGWLSASQKHSGDFTENDRTILVQLAQLSALAIENMILNEVQQAQQVGNSLVQELDEDRLLQLLTDEATQRTSASLGAFFFMEGGDDYALYTLSGSSKQEFAERVMHRLTPLFSDTFHGKGPLRIADVRADRRFGEWSDSPDAQPPVASYLAVPVVSRTGKVLGGLFLAHREADRFTPEHERIVIGIAQQASIALENARLYTELRRSETRARDAYEAIALSNRQKDQFLATLSHELRNPLAPIITGIEILRRRRQGGREVDVIERQVHNLVHLVDDLLDLSRIHRGRIDLDRSRIELFEAIQQAVETAHPLLEQKRHEVLVDVPRVGLVVEGDLLRLTQVFANLLTNAAKFTDPGGIIHVEASRTRDWISISVIDSGVGISAEEIPALFQEFKQVHRSLDRSRGGLGLGLHIAKRLVEMHGGSIDAESEGVGKGSRFVVRLPASSRLELAPADPIEAASAPSPVAARRILVVDDNVDAAEMLAITLQQAGHDVAIAFSGPEALDTARVFRPEVAVLDIGLPGMDGYELARTLRRDMGPLPLIALSGFGQEGDRKRSREAGFDVHLVKPIAPDDLEAAIQALLEASASSTQS